MRNSLLKMVRENARLTEDQLAAMLNTTPDAVRRELTELEKEGIICGYHAVVDWEKVDPESATAIKSSICVGYRAKATSAVFEFTSVSNSPKPRMPPMKSMRLSVRKSPTAKTGFKM